MRGNALVMTCDASLLDFQPSSIEAHFTAHPECDPNYQCSLEGSWVRSMGVHAPVAAVDR